MSVGVEIVVPTSTYLGSRSGSWSRSEADVEMQADVTAMMMTDMVMQ